MRPLLPLLIILGSCLALPLARADEFVTLDNHQRIAGVVENAAADPNGKVEIKTGHGLIRISRALVVSEDLSYEARRAKVTNTDYPGLVALARWCRAKGLNKQALELLDLAITLPAVELPDRALHVRLVDEQRSAEEALPLYQNYRQLGGKDPDTLARLGQLEKAKADFDNQNSDTASIISPPAGDGAGNVPTGPMVNTSLGLELKNWDPEAAQYSNPIDSKIVTVATAAGQARARQISVSGGQLPKAALRCNLSLAIIDKSVLTFLAENPGSKPVSIAIAVKTGDAWEFHESPQKSIPPGDFHKVSFDLKGSNFKSKATNWMSNGKIANLDDVKELQLIIYNGAKASQLLITNMGFPAKPEL